MKTLSNTPDPTSITTAEAHSALNLLSAILYSLEDGRHYTLGTSDLSLIQVVLALMPEMPLVKAEGGE